MRYLARTPYDQYDILFRMFSMRLLMSRGSLLKSIVSWITVPYALSSPTLPAFRLNFKIYFLKLSIKLLLNIEYLQFSHFHGSFSNTFRTDRNDFKQSLTESKIIGNMIFHIFIFYCFSLSAFISNF